MGLKTNGGGRPGDDRPFSTGLKSRSTVPYRYLGGESFYRLSTSGRR